MSKVIVAICVFFACCIYSADAKEFVNSKYLLSINLPDDWSYEGGHADGTLVKSVYRDTVGHFVMLTVAAYDTPEKEYFKMINEDPAVIASSILAAYPNMDAQLISARHAEIDKHICFEIKAYLNHASGMRRRVTTYFIPRQHSLVTISVSMNFDENDVLEKKIADVISSVDLKDKGIKN